MLIMKGKPVRKGGRIEGANIVDLAPTILYVLGLPIPQDMDGRPLREAFQEGYVQAMPLAYSEAASSTGSKETGYTKEGEREIKERLRGLGYLG
jgi:arylsulfatase A-like enzyme